MRELEEARVDLWERVMSRLISERAYLSAAEHFERERVAALSGCPGERRLHTAGPGHPLAVVCQLLGDPFIQLKWLAHHKEVFLSRYI